MGCGASSPANAAQPKQTAPKKREERKAATPSQLGQPVVRIQDAKRSKKCVAKSAPIEQIAGGSAGSGSQPTASDVDPVGPIGSLAFVANKKITARDNRIEAETKSVSNKDCFEENVPENVISRHDVNRAGAIDMLEQYHSMCNRTSKPMSHRATIASAAVQASFDMDACMIVVFTDDMETATLMSKLKPLAPILVITTQQEVTKMCISNNDLTAMQVASLFSSGAFTNDF